MIKICDGYYYNIEENQYTLIHQYEKKKGVFGKPDVDSGETVTKCEEIGYFDSLGYMLKRLARILCKEQADAGRITTIGKHIETLKSLEAKLTEICKGE